LKGIDVGGYTLPSVLEGAIREYKESAEVFGSHPEAISSAPPSPEFKAISDRYFNARNNLARVTKESDDPRALRWYKAYVAASENTTLMLSKEANETLEGCERIVGLCAERMNELKEAEEELLDCEF
jgi:ketopantoate reductase